MTALPKKIPALAFHKVDNAFEWGVTRVTPRQFTKVIQRLSAWGYNTILPRDLNDPDNLPPNPIIIAFDDAYASVVENAFPVLQSFGMHACIYVISGYVGQWNTWDVNLGGIQFKHASWKQLATLRDAGWEIGSHTHHHPDLSRFDRDTVTSECQQSKQEIENRLNIEVTSISPPFGRYHEETLNIISQCGYQRVCAFWANQAAKKQDNLVVIERKAYYLFDGPFALRAKCTQSIWSRLESAKLRVINFFSHGTAIVKPVQCNRLRPESVGNKT